MTQVGACYSGLRFHQRNFSKCSTNKTFPFACARHTNCFRWEAISSERIKTQQDGGRTGSVRVRASTNVLEDSDVWVIHTHSCTWTERVSCCWISYTWHINSHHGNDKVCRCGVHRSWRFTVDLGDCTDFLFVWEVELPEGIDQRVRRFAGAILGRLSGNDLLKILYPRS